MRAWHILRPMVRLDWILLGAALVGTASHAEDKRLTNLTRELNLATAPAARAHAAQGLAKLDDAQAVTPLCQALAGDKDSGVRVAVAKALGTLGGLEAAACLKRTKDPAPDARAAVAAALETLHAVSEERPIRYVALLPLDSQHNALGADAGALAQRQLRHVLERRGSVVEEKVLSANRTRALLKARKLEGYALKVSLDKTEGGVSLDLLCTHYPTGGLIGDVTVSAKGAQVADLIRALVPRALDEAESACGWRVE